MDKLSPCNIPINKLNNWPIYPLIVILFLAEMNILIIVNINVFGIFNCAIYKYIYSLWVVLNALLKSKVISASKI